MGSRTTVVVATYNRRALLEETVDSVRRQAGSPRLLVVDDCSSDDTPSYLAAQSDITALTTPARSERAVARNLGIGAVETEFVLVLDDDDTLRDGAVGGLEAALDRYPAAAAAIGGWWPVPGPPDGPYPLNPTRTACGRWWRELLLGWNPATAGQLLFRTSALRDAGGFAPDFPGIDDFVLLLNLAYRSPLAVVPTVVLNYRIHPGQQKQSDDTWDPKAREAFVASVGPDDRAEAALLLATKPDFLRAVQSRDRDGRAALRRFLKAAPWALRSPVIGRPVARLLLSMAGEVVLPRPWVAALQRRYGHAQRSVGH
ncbi:MAG TPA: glycosyltransferase family 2 protein [Mycobacteriales bacterium]|nr:glycosyltransferase family 2 protein [Mycobacteriales bacterium]